MNKKYSQKHLLGALNVFCRAKDRLAVLNLSTNGEIFVGMQTLEKLSKLIDTPIKTKIRESRYSPIHKSVEYRGVIFYSTQSPDDIGCQKIEEKQTLVQVPSRTEVHVEETWKCPEGKTFVVEKTRY